MNKKIEILSNFIKQSNHIVFFGGAGVSTESGIPDFRSQDGLYHQQFDYPPEEILSHSFFLTHTKEFYQFYKQKMNALDFSPNITHWYLAKLEQAKKLTAVITQNIDGLHQKAGSHTVYELHGSIYRNYCMKCGKFFSAEAIFHNKSPICYCPCGGMIKPDVVLYQEPLDDMVVKNAILAISQSDLLIIGGTSLQVYPANSLIQYFHGKHLVVINNEPPNFTTEPDLFLQEKLGTVFNQLDSKKLI